MEHKWEARTAHGLNFFRETPTAELTYFIVSQTLYYDQMIA